MKKLALGGGIEVWLMVVEDLIVRHVPLAYLNSQAQVYVLVLEQGLTSQVQAVEIEIDQTIWLDDQIS